MIPKTREDADLALQACAQMPPDRFDLMACAIACALHENPDRDIGGALETLDALTKAAQQQKPNSPSDFAHLLYGSFGFSGGKGDYDAPSQADIIDILTLRGGLPVGLGHVWRYVGIQAGAPLFGTNTPGHFIMRLDAVSGPIFLDPFEGGAIVDQEALDGLAQRAGLEVLTEAILAPVRDKMMAIRLQTNLIARARARGDYEAWWRAAYRRSLLAPQNYEVALDYANACRSIGHLKTAYDWSQIAANLPDAPHNGHHLAQRQSQSIKHILN
jgi:regulator of sirC expression with transglutaminase-like and TPR domain